MGDMGGVRAEGCLRELVSCCGVEGTDTDRDDIESAAGPDICPCGCTCTGRGSPGSAVPDLPRLSPTDSRNVGAVAASGLPAVEADDEPADGDSLRGRVRAELGVTGAAGDSSSTASDDRNLTVEATAPHQPDETVVDAVDGE